MDLVIPCRPGKSNIELLYALRSAAANLPHDRVFIIGDKPQWVANVHHIPAPKLETKYRTTSQHMRLACEHSEISNPFIWSNDDIYVVAAMTEVPTLHRGPIAGVIEEYHRKGITRSRYIQGMQETLDLLVANGYPEPLSYELHVPLTIWKQPMLEALDMAEASGIAVAHKRSMYAAVAGLGGEFSHDVKMVRPTRRPPDGPFLSSSDRTFPRTVGPLLRRLFPDPGPYERARASRAVRRAGSVAARR